MPVAAPEHKVFMCLLLPQNTKCSCACCCPRTQSVHVPVANRAQDYSVFMFVCLLQHLPPEDHGGSGLYYKVYWRLHHNPDDMWRAVSAEGDGKRGGGGMQHTHTHTRTHTCMHAHTHTHSLSLTHAHTHTYTHTHILTHTPSHTHTLTPTHTHTYTHILTHTHMHTPSHTHTHTFMYAHTLTHSHTHMSQGQEKKFLKRDRLSRKIERNEGQAE